MTRLPIVIVVLIAGTFFGAGCVDERCRGGCFDPGDTAAPASPQEVWSVTGDGEVTLYWSPPYDADLAGFRISVSRDDRDYWQVAEVAAGQHHLVVHGAMLPVEADFDFSNGTTYWLGVQAYDWSGNRSELVDAAVTFDTPRPAGRGLRLYAIEGPRWNESGYDFSRSPYGYALDGNSLFADVYFSDESVPMMRTAHPQVVEMQDAGWLDFDDDRVGWLDESTWAPHAAVRLVPGHVVLVKLFEETRPGNTTEPFHVAKFQVVSVEPGSVVIDWAYQIQPNSRELKPSPAPSDASTPRELASVTQEVRP